MNIERTSAAVTSTTHFVVPIYSLPTSQRCRRGRSSGKLARVHTQFGVVYLNEVAEHFNSPNYEGHAPFPIQSLVIAGMLHAPEYRPFRNEP